MAKPVLNEAMRKGSVIEDDETRQFQNVLTYARKNPTTQIDIFALDASERDRLRALLVSMCGESAPPSNILVSVRDTTPSLPVLLNTDTGEMRLAGSKDLSRPEANAPKKLILPESRDD